MTARWFLALYVALIGVLLFTTPAHSAHCRGTNGRFIKCPPPPPPPTPTGTWVSAPLTVGGYAFVTGSGTCCNGLVIKLTGVNGTMMLGQFYSDSSGNFPVSDAYEIGLQGWYNVDSIQGVAPGP